MIDFTPEQNKFYRNRLLQDYERLIDDIEKTSATKGETFCMFITPMDGRLIVASLRTARDGFLAGGKP